MHPPLKRRSIAARFIVSLEPALVISVLAASLCTGASFLYLVIRVSSSALQYSGRLGLVWLLSFVTLFILLALLSSIDPGFQAIRYGIAYSNQGHELLNRRDYKGAISYLSEAVTNFERVTENSNIKHRLAVDLDDLGLAYRHTGQLEASLDCRKRSLTHFEEMGKEEDQALVLHAIGVLYAQMGQPDDAELYYNRALTLACHVHNLWIEGSSLDDLAELYEDRDQYQQALQARTQALQIFTQAEEQGNASIALARMAELYLLLDNIPAAVEACEQSIKVAVNAPVSAWALATFVLGAICTYCEDMEGSIHCLHYTKQTSDMDEDLDIPLLYLLGMNTLDIRKIDGEIFFRFYQKTIWRPRQIAFRKPSQTPPTSPDFDADDLIGVGLVAWQGIESAAAEKKKLIESAQKDQNWSLMIAHQRQLSAAYAAEGDFAQATSLQWEALDVACKWKQTRAEEACQFSLALLDLASDTPAIANVHIEELLRVAGRDMESSRLVEIYLKCAFIASELGMTTRAQDLIKHAQLLCQGMNDRSTEVRILALLGQSYQASGTHNKAIACFTEGLKILAGDPLSVIALRLRTVRVGSFLQLGKIDQAITELTEVIKDIETVQEKLSAREYTVRFLLSTRATAEAYLVTALVNGKHNLSEANQKVEQAKLALLATILGQRRLSWWDNPFSGSLTPKETTRKQQVALPRALEEATIWQFLTSQPGHVVIAQYYCTDECVFLFVLDSQKRAIECQKIPLTMAKLQRCLTQFEREVCNRPGTEPLTPTWQETAVALVEPLLPHLTNCNLLCLVPHNLLYRLPLHAITVNGRYLLEYCPVVYTPSITMLVHCHHDQPRRWETALVVGDPAGGLRHAAEEANEVAKLLDVQPLLLDRVLMSIWEVPRNEDIIHISSHGYFDDHDPMSSGIVMTDGLLTIERLREVKLNTQLVTLSACETGMMGQELIGFSSALLAIGVPSVVVSLWPVDDAGSADLMRRLYAHLKYDGYGLARALQLAQLELAYQSNWHHPYFWAPFVVVGDWH